MVTTVCYIYVYVCIVYVCAEWLEQPLDFCLLLIKAEVSDRISIDICVYNC